MTVMLLQRSVTPQSTHSQKTANKDCNAKPPFLFLLDDCQEHSHSVDTTITTTTTNNNNNNNNKRKQEIKFKKKQTKGKKCVKIDK